MERCLHASIFAQLCCNCLKCELIEEKQATRDFVLNPDTANETSQSRNDMESKSITIPNWMSRPFVFKVRYSITNYIEADSGGPRLRPKIKFRENFKLLQF